MAYQADPGRYQSMAYRRCGDSGLKLPAISLGLWHNFGDTTLLENSRQLLRRAFDLGITHFDLANNYGPPPGSAERNFGRILQEDLLPWRDELIISTKAGYTMWEGPYGDWGSRKYLIASLDQSLKRMGLEYVDIFYHHRPDPETPLQETMRALDHVVRQGKALYVGLSNYPAALAREAIDILNDLGTPCLIHQPKYSMFERCGGRGTAGRAAGKRGGLYSLLAAGWRPADRPLSARHPGRFARGQRQPFSESGAAHHTKTGHRARVECVGATARSEAVPDGAGLGTAR